MEPSQQDAREKRRESWRATRERARRGEVHPDIVSGAREPNGRLRPGHAVTPNAGTRVLSDAERLSRAAARLAQAQVPGVVLDYLQLVMQHSAEAIATFVEVMRDPDASRMEKVAAARSLLDHADPMRASHIDSASAEERAKRAAAAKLKLLQLIDSGSRTHNSADNSLI